MADKSSNTSAAYRTSDASACHRRTRSQSSRTKARRSRLPHETKRAIAAIGSARRRLPRPQPHAPDRHVARRAAWASSSTATKSSGRLCTPTCSTTTTRVCTRHSSTRHRQPSSDARLKNHVSTKAKQDPILESAAPPRGCRTCRTLGPMPSSLPHFKYHPEPLRTGAIEAREVTCACCEKQRPYVYVAPVYGDRDLDGLLCPWCIADGSAAAKLGASFADSHPLLKAGVPAAIAEEVSRRTPSYFSWQAEQWLAHCNDACEFHGDASREEVCSATVEAKKAWCQRYAKSEQEWDRLAASYAPAGDHALYKFVCRHCHAICFGWDLS